MNTRQTPGADKYVVVGAGKYLLLQVLLALRTFTDADCMVICAPGTRLLRHSLLISDYLETALDGGDDEAVIERIHRFAGKTVQVMLIPADSVAARWVDRVGASLAVSVIPAPNAGMLDRFDNKWHFYQFCRAHGLPVPQSRYAADKRQLYFDDTAARLGLPFIIKPVNEQASIGTYVVANEDAYRRHVLDNDAYQYAPLIAQRYIAGSDVGIDLLAVDGKIEALAIQRRIDPTHDGSRIEFFPHAGLEEAAHIIARKSHYTGVMNIDARIDSMTGAIYLLESNPRFWRSLSASVWCGLNFVEKSVVQRDEHGLVKLTAGSADTYYHPMFRPSLWPHAAFDKTHRGRMVRIMACEICTFTMSGRILAVRTRDAIRRLYRSLLYEHKIFDRRATPGRTGALQLSASSSRKARRADPLDAE